MVHHPALAAGGCLGREHRPFPPGLDGAGAPASRAGFRFAVSGRVPGVYLDRRRRSGLQLYEALGIERDDKARRASQSFENFRLFGAPHVAIVTVARELGAYGAVDVGGFVGAFLLAAHAHGVATTPQAALAMQSGFIRRYFGLDEGRAVVCGISFGYADRAHPVNGYRTERAGLDDILQMV